MSLFDLSTTDEVELGELYRKTDMHIIGFYQFDDISEPNNPGAAAALDTAVAFEVVADVHRPGNINIDSDNDERDPVVIYDVIPHGSEPGDSDHRRRSRRG